VRDILEKELESFGIHIVLNQIRSSREIMIGTSVKSVCLKFLGFNAQYAGHIEYDESVLRCINKRRPFMLTHPFSHVAKEISKLTDNLREDRQAVINDRYAHRRL